MAQTQSMQSGAVRRSQRRPPSKVAYEALRYFNATSVEEAEPAARNVLAGVQSCSRCNRLLAQRFNKLGSTLFYDENPRVLAQAFDRDDRDACTLRLLAACIVLFGRERVPLETIH